ncbi:MAG: hypothetical protein ABW321_16660 [Polyangiales bacterium]
MTKLLSRSAFFAALSVAGLAAFELQAPTLARESDALKYVGVLHASNGEAVSGQHAIGIEVWDDASAGRRLCVIAPQAIEVSDGHFSLELSSACLGAVQHGTGLWTEVRIDGEHLLPRAALGSSHVPPARDKQPTPAQQPAAPREMNAPAKAAPDAPKTPTPNPPAVSRPAEPADTAPTSVLLI